ncbi:hypothetical protein F4810DRAFT_725950 [Camillea tinctor]|nr:hypothetical protein F4810DRAFT_725950 [Camillea tinctor]
MKFLSTFVAVLSLGAATLTSAGAISPRRDANWKDKAVTSTAEDPLCSTQNFANINNIMESVDRIILRDPERKYPQEVVITGKRNVQGLRPGIDLRIHGTQELTPIKRIKELLMEMPKHGIMRCGAISLAWPNQEPMSKHGWLQIDYTEDVKIQE